MFRRRAAPPRRRTLAARRAGGAATWLFLARIKAASGTTEDAVLAPWWSLALIPVGAVLVVAAVTGLPARLATRIRTADALRYE